MPGLGRGREVASPAWLRCQLLRRALTLRLGPLRGSEPPPPPQPLRQLSGCPQPAAAFPEGVAGKRGERRAFFLPLAWNLSLESVKVILVNPRLAFLLICVCFAKTMANCEAVGMGTITDDDMS